MPAYDFYICDVFTESRFGGNPLAILPEATGLTDHQMQNVAREFNFSETAFVFSSTSDSTWTVRIFTPTVEIPFAGHPNIGTAFVLATSGALGEIDGSTTVTFEEKAGPVVISIERRNGIWCELSAPEKISVGSVVPAQLLADVVGVDEGDVVTSTHAPQVASVGLPFLIAELRNRQALERARVNLDPLRKLVAMNIQSEIHLYTMSDDEFDIRARMFAPFDGVPEDPATGSANGALAGLLCYYSTESDISANWRVAQGVEMGRPSLLNLRAEKRDGIVTDTFVGGSCVMVGRGVIQVD